MSAEAKPYQHTIHLPKTAFPMKADLPVREREWLERWRSEHLYDRIRKKSAGRSKFILHDGPPYANGHIHIGHAFNKILKDMIVKYKTMRGSNAHYVPGWDCHGLPIEHALFQEMGKRKDEVEQLPFRKKARDYAQKYVSIQREEFIRLGVFGDWDEPYLTMAPVYQAKIAESFLTLLERGYIEQRLKPVPWCYDCETALAEAELDYEEKTSPSIYVKFKGIAPENGSRPYWAVRGDRPFYFLVWTTTPWTLPANVGLALHPDLTYIAVTEPERKATYVFAEALVERIAPITGLSPLEATDEVGRFQGKEFVDRYKAQHPFIPGRQSAVVLADYVSSTDGTGIVHIAPGHGEEDYVVGLKYKLPILSPVDEKGRFTSEVPEAQGMLVHKEGNKNIIELLKGKGALVHNEPYRHSYPHCWRCKNPVVFRATEQWFLKVDHDGLRTKVSEIVDQGVQFTPDWGKKRIGSMVTMRPDWCLSRQRYWGVPVPIIRCATCSRLLASESKSKIVSVLASEGADSWFERPAESFLPDRFRCSCGSRSFKKESDIIDVWFDSGVSHQAVLKDGNDLAYPADLYAEGSDQHRGWFQTALLTGVALDGHSPFKGVLTHGFVVDGEGKKMSKSRGNVVSPQEVMDEFGADLLRLWVAASDYQFDVRLSVEILKRMVEGYRRIRNTFRFLLGNLHDFDYKLHRVAFGEMESVDRWALGRCLLLVRSVTQYDDRYLFHHVYRAVQDYLVVDLSSFYLDILKDRLYTAARNSRKRRSAQTALFYLLRNLVKILAPILPFTCDEAWRSYQIEEGVTSVHEADWPGDDPELIDQNLIGNWQDLLAVRDVINKKIEMKREAKEIGSSLEVRLLVEASDQELSHLLRRYEHALGEAFIVSQVELDSQDNMGEWISVHFPSDGRSHAFRLSVARAQGAKCERCWKYSVHVGTFPDHPSLCEYCMEVTGSVSS